MGTAETVRHNLKVAVLGAVLVALTVGAIYLGYSFDKRLCNSRLSSARNSSDTTMVMTFYKPCELVAKEDAWRAL